ncbi:hypothetical protein [Thalassospira mesophila]|uniref:Uncharacterized protein n=1 Tax=Thalassospira mesophila TaxID=1293891 RepID=A0A1Y2KVK6_9PROT|nr:hypothetical protein [Thalassospira mesophila]OSQ35872.1 hypothetical protein TMES_19965 [Thalassospira mesophila]
MMDKPFTYRSGARHALTRDIVKQGEHLDDGVAFDIGHQVPPHPAAAQVPESAELVKIFRARREGEFISAAAMKDRITAIANAKRRAHGL